MFVRNWMLPQQFSISSDALAAEAAALIAQHRLKMLPVVDNGRLRGVVHRRDLSEAAMCVSGSGDMCEMNYFCNKLKVKDVMVRMPVTISVDDSVEDVLIKGRELMMSTFPVMDGDRVVGVVSDREIFVMLFKLLEAGQECTRVTLADVSLEQDTLLKIVKILEESNCVIKAFFTVPEGKTGVARVVLRTDCKDSETLYKNLQDNNFKILEFRGETKN
ncbi:MAG: CBS domain-containing protein [Deltaproteobacteria bacterium]|nr:CBS domain-containing protein [Deltaproteobacteria bacterium]